VIGLVGRRVTLNGRSSTPAGRIGFRWIQVEGPPIKAPLDEGDVLTFVPGSPGTYRFALVVAEEGLISEPDFAAVLVVDGAPEAARQSNDAARPTSAEEAARQALGAFEDGRPSAEALAAAFETIAVRIDLYETYADILQGTSSGLEPVLPSDPARRTAWNDRLFVPLSRHLIDDMRTLGLDLSRPEALNVPLSAAARNRLADEFRAMARGFRSASLPGKREGIAEPDRIDPALLTAPGGARVVNAGSGKRVGF